MQRTEQDLALILGKNNFMRCSVMVFYFSMMTVQAQSVFDDTGIELR